MGAGAGAGVGVVEFCWGFSADDPPPPQELIIKLKNNIFFDAFLSILISN